MRPHILLTLAALCASTPLPAHDFWIDLPSYRQAAGQTFPIRLLIGDIGAVEPWETLWRKIVSFRDHAPSGVVDQQAALRETTPAGPGGASITLAEAGTHTLAFESYQAENDIPADDFNAYARHEGLTPALEKRARDGSMGARGRELYSRRAKALVQIGDRPTANVLTPIGQTLEIVPERNPFTLAPDARLPLRIYYRGLPLAGASVVLEPLDGASTHGVPAITDAAGRVSFALRKAGRWRAGVVWTQPIGHPRADFDTVFASLTFGY